MMKSSCARFLVIVFLFAAVSSAGDASDEAIKKDRMLIEGTWKVIALEHEGDHLAEEDFKNMIVVNGADGSWSFNVNGKEECQGSTKIDPTKKPKTIDITVTVGEGKGEQTFGIYEVGEKTRKLCFVERGKERPTEFSTTKQNGRTLVTFERIKAKWAE